MYLSSSPPARQLIAELAAERRKVARLVAAGDKLDTLREKSSE